MEQEEEYSAQGELVVLLCVDSVHTYWVFSFHLPCVSFYYPSWLPYTVMSDAITAANTQLVLFMLTPLIVTAFHGTLSLMLSLLPIGAGKEGHPSPFPGHHLAAFVLCPQLP